MLAALPRVGKVDKAEWTKAFRRVWLLAGGDAWRYNEETWGGAQRQALKPRKAIELYLSYKEAPTAWLTYVADYIDTKGGDNITEISATTQDKVKNAIFAGVEREEGIPQIAERVAGVYDGFEGYRATMIARSEVVDASNQASLAQARDAGSTLDLMWVATNDDRTREEHAAMDGVTVAYDQEFECDDGTTMPGEAVNCRCTIGYAIPTEPVAEDAAAAEEIPPVEWQDSRSTDTLETLLKENLGIDANMAGVDLEYANATTEALFNLAQDPKYKELLDGLNILHGNDQGERALFWSFRGNTNDIYMNQLLDSKTAMMNYANGKYAVLKDMTPDVVSANATTWRESIQWNLEHELWHLKSSGFEATGDMGASRVFNKAVQVELGNNLSFYSAYSDREAAAEAYTAYAHGLTDNLPESVIKYFRMKL